MSVPCVIPVCAADAILWAAGKLTDRALLLNAPLVPEAVFIVSLPDLRSYCQALRLVAYWKARGAVTLITRTGSATVASHLLKNGCVASLKENGTPTKTRFLAPPEAFARWTAKFAKSSL